MLTPQMRFPLRAACRIAFFFLILASLMWSRPAHGQKPTLAGIAHAAIRVSDLSKSRDFYERLGFEVAFAMSKDGKPTEVFLKINDRQFIELYPQRNPSEPVGFMHVCFESLDLQALHDIYLARGLSPIPVKRAGAGNLLFTMPGPEHQNIEYTQYMPGSMHWNDRGKHLGSNRISGEMVGLSLAMQDPAAATIFYKDKLAFAAAYDPSNGKTTALSLPGSPAQQIEIIPAPPRAAFQILFASPNLRMVRKQCEALGLSVEKEGSKIVLTDPDGNRLIVVKSGKQRSNKGRI